jgi:hypothetical protein
MGLTQPPPDDGGRYPNGHPPSRPYTVFEHRLIVNALCLCRGSADWHVACRALCAALGRKPSLKANVKPTVRKYSIACENILCCELWKVLRGYGGRQISPPPDQGRRGGWPVTWGEQKIIGHWRRLGRPCSLTELTVFLGRWDMAEISGYNTPTDNGGSSSLRETALETVLRQAAAGPAPLPECLHPIESLFPEK